MNLTVHGKTSIRHWRAPLRIVCLMQLSFFLLTTLFLQIASASSYAQRITLNEQHVPLTQVFEQIKSQSGYHFFWRGSNLENLSVSVHVKNADIKETMDIISKQLPLKYAISKKSVIITAKSTPSQLSGKLPNSAQQVYVRGRITDETGTPLPSVNVRIKSSQTVVASDAQGNYEIQVESLPATLEFSLVGYHPYEQTVTKAAEINVILSSKNTGLDEVVVIGYGTRRRTSVTSSISKLENVKLDQVPSARIENALAGRISGVSISNSSNEPGVAPQIRVRGLGSISAGNEPLVVIDGFPGGNLGQLNTNDVESIEVLKDASSTAIYGSRGAGGVILITTKRGRAGKPVLRLNSYVGVAKGIVHNDWLTGEEWYDYLTRYQNREFAWAGGDTSIPVWGDDRRPLSYQVNPLTYELPQTIWQNEILQTAPIQNHNLSVSGGNESTKYYVSGTFAHEDGVIKTASYRQYSVRANVDVKINDAISLGVELSPFYNKRRNAGSNMVSLVKYPNFVSPDRVDGKYPRAYDYVTTGHTSQGSPYTLLYGAEDYNSAFTNIGRASVNLRFSEDLSFKTTLGTNISFGSTDRFVGGVGDTQINTNGNAGDTQSFNVVNENVLSYNKDLNDNHTLGGVLGASYQNSTSRSTALYAIANSFNNEIVKTLNNAIINPNNTTQTKSEWGLISYFARINYSFQDKYLIEASSRFDGSSRFGDENKWGHFPSVSAAWRVSEEAFLKNSDLVSSLKLRASYGVTGNFNIGNFQYLGAVGQVNYSPDNKTENAFIQTSLENQNLSWEKTNGYDFGVDLGLFKNRLNITLDLYNNSTTNMLYAVNIPALTGFTSTITNVGEVSNKGLDLEITTQNLVGDFKWNTAFNISHNKNEVVDLGEVDERINTYWSMDFVLREGEPMFSYLGYKMTGIFQNEDQISKFPHLANTQPGNPILEDVNDDGIIDPQDKVILGNFQPKLNLGMTNDLSWKGFDASVFLAASFGAKIFNGENQYYEGNTMGAMRRSLVENQWWSEEEPGDGTTPAAALSQLGFNTNTDYYIEDASFVSVRNVNLGYTFSNLGSKNWGIKNLRLYTSINNLFVFKSKGNHSYNPEGTTRGEVSGISSTPGVNLGSYPLNRTFVLGLNIEF